MSDPISRFKQLFLSPRNTKHILELALSKLDVDQETLRAHVPRYERSLFELQNFIFDNFFNRPEVLNGGAIELETSLISLNKLTISKLKQYIEQDIQVISRSNALQNSQNVAAPNDPRRIDQCFIEQQPSPQQMSTPISNLPEPKVMEIQTEQNQHVVTKFHHFFSSDAKLENGRYTFPFQISGVKYVSLSAFKLDCNMYNITESNNKFMVSETETRIPCSIPVGYYSIDDLLESMANIINTNSKHKYEYTVTRNKTKNKVYIQCNKTFNLHFNSSQNVPVPLQTLLGFKKTDYMNNNTYVSESQPEGSIFDDIYIKLFFSEKEVTKYFTTKNNFGYFHSFQLDYHELFGRRYFCTPSQQDYFECDQDTSMDNLSFELWHTPDKPYTRHLDFDVILSFETIASR